MLKDQSKGGTSTTRGAQPKKVSKSTATFDEGTDGGAVNQPPNSNVKFPVPLAPVMTANVSRGRFTFIVNRCLETAFKRPFTSS